MQNLGWFGRLGNITIRQSIYDFLFDFNRNYVSILYRFRVTVSYLSKVADFNLLHLHLVPHLNFAVIFITGKLQSPWAIVWHYLHNPMFSRFDTVPECDRQTHDDGIYRASIALCSKNDELFTVFQASASIQHDSLVSVRAAGNSELFLATQPRTNLMTGMNHMSFTGGLSSLTGGF